IELLFSSCLASVAFFVSCKMTKILRFIAIFADTLDHAGISIKDFVMPFILIMCALNVSLYCLLWNKLESYNSAVATFRTTTAGILGKFVVVVFQTSTLASMIFTVFKFTGTTFFINIFVMIILFEFKEI
ncbi:hypothetical protein Angca_002362, partial [Angiostrongylus cantonensis]